ncbi:hypothetical protein BKK79_02845 [Cupriavidus sp. USMAA2-4]|uniref:Type VI secretion system-associated protein TagF n=2 Tax=Burkholderiaceae TaxID=119060 RepID=A0ABN4TMB5_9BURK|nr:hypothetical protein BKK79_02845 [Cupriavidus sp. USMAA2-4]AOZ06175.1 hypothetical protein BKK80_10265 [Cupriavidus malaysiensis]
MISVPSIFGKLPDSGAFICHNAPLHQVKAWRTWFEPGDAGASRAMPGASVDGHRPHWLHLTPPSLVRDSGLCAGEPCYFILRPHGLRFPSDADYLIGIVTASRDRVGRRYSLVVWQAASAKWAELMLAAPANWLTDLAQVVHDHARLPGPTGLNGMVDALWANYRPGWRDRLSAVLKRLADSRDEAASGDLPGEPLAGLVDVRRDWPPTLLRGGSHGSVWQANTGRAIDIDCVSSLRRLLADL